MTSSPKTQAWFTEARNDLSAGKALLAISEEYLKKSAFFAQQCVEKAFKGFLNHHRKRTQRTHDMRLLAKEVISIKPELEPLLEQAAKLTVFVVATRYPDAATSAVDQLTKADVEALLEYANTVLQKLRAMCSD